MKHPRAERSPWLWFVATLLAMSIVTYIWLRLPH
jgi:hypothetical protein